jgi:hypothetical protein
MMWHQAEVVSPVKEMEEESLFTGRIESFLSARSSSVAPPLLSLFLLLLSRSFSLDIMVALSYA